MTWAHNRDHHSALSAVSLHFMVDLVGQLFELTERAGLHTIVSWILAAIAVTIISGPRTLTHLQRSPDSTGKAASL